MKFKLPSINTLWSGTIRVFKRFPLEVIIALACTIVWYLIATRKNEADDTSEMIKFIFIGNLALTLMLSADLYSEVNAYTEIKKWALRVLVLLLSTGLFFFLKPNFYDADIYRIAMLALAFHLLVAIAPFIGRGSLEGFWEYNKSLFLRFLASALYAAVLFAGLSAALAAIDALFNIKIGWEIYMRLFAIVVAGFSPIFFLAGVPDLEKLSSNEAEYPKGLKLFTQYVLIPLMTIYLAILLVYEVKIILDWEFPKGMVSLLILGYAIFGILSLLLIYPIRNKEGFGWIKLFSRFFYFTMIPLVVLLLLAVWTRVQDYGITESRYILLCLAGWLTFITVYFLISKEQNIKLIPASLCILALLAVYGPQSAFSVSRYSQLARLKTLNKEKLKDEDRAEVIRYLVKKHGLSSLQEFTKIDLEAMEKRIADETKDQSYMTKFDLVDTAFKILKIKTETANMDQYVTFISEKAAVLIKGYQYIIPLDNYETKVETTVNGIPFMLIKDVAKNTLTVSIGGNKTAVVFDINPEAIKLKSLLQDGRLKKDQNYQTYYFPTGFGLAPITYGKYELLFKPTSISGSIEMKRNLSTEYKGYLLVRIK
jgi:hypothetical protein